MRRDVIVLAAYTTDSPRDTHQLDYIVLLYLADRLRWERSRRPPGRASPLGENHRRVVLLVEVAIELCCWHSSVLLHLL